MTATSECDPDKLEDGLATNVLDGKEDNYWHTDVQTKMYCRGASILISADFTT